MSDPTKRRRHSSRSPDRHRRSSDDRGARPDHHRSRDSGRHRRSDDGRKRREDDRSYHRDSGRTRPSHDSHERKRGRWGPRPPQSQFQPRSPQQGGRGATGSTPRPPQPQPSVELSRVPQELPNDVLKTMFATKQVTTRDGAKTKLTANVHIEEGHLLSSLIKENRLSKCLEVGCAYGVSALFMCQALRDSETTISANVEASNPDSAQSASKDTEAEQTAASSKTDENETAESDTSDDTANPPTSKDTASGENANNVVADKYTDAESVKEAQEKPDTEQIATGVTDANDGTPSADTDSDRFLISIDPNQTGKWKEVGLFSIESAGLKKYHRCFEDKSYNVMPKLLPAHSKQLDLVFIDGWHTFDYTLVDGFYADLLVRPGGYIVFDDALHKGPNKVVQYFRTNYPHWKQLQTYTAGGKVFRVPRTTALFQKTANDSRAWNYHTRF